MAPRKEGPGPGRSNKGHPTGHPFFFYIIEKGLACTIAIMVLYSHHSLGIQSYLLKFGTTGPSKRTHPSQGVRLDC